MRKLFALLTLFVSLFAMSCEEPAPENPTNNVTFDFSELTATQNSVSYTITPSDLEAGYLTTVVETAEIAGKSDTDIINLTEENLSVNKGVKSVTKSGLKSDTAYSIVAYAIGGSKVSQYPFFTQSGNNGGGSFSVSINITDLTASTATATATPSDNTTRYFFRVITQLELREFGILDNDLEIFKYIVENPNSNSFIFTGTKVLEYTNLSPKMDYLAVAFNVETYQDVLDGNIEVELFRYEFTTPDAPPVDPSTLFAYTNLNIEHTGFSVDVTPIKGDDKLWSYYIFEKANFYEYVNKGHHQVVMRAYYGLYNLCQEYNIYNQTELSFNKFMCDYMGQYGATTINNYEALKPAKDYVVALFYVDPEVYDPTVVYDYNYVAIEFTTSSPDDDLRVKMDVSEPIIEKEGFGYKIMFNVKIDNNATSLKYGAAEWSALVEQYYDPNDPNSIRAFVNFKNANSEVMAAAQQESGTTIIFDSQSAFDGVFFFEAANEQGAVTQIMFRVTPDMFE